MRGKRGSESVETSITQVGMLIFAALFIIFAVLLAINLYNGTFSSQNQGTKESIKNFAEKVNALEPDTLASQAFNVQGGFYLFGFGKKDTQVLGRDIAVHKNDAGCNGLESCLCVCDDKNCDGRQAICAPEGKLSNVDRIVAGTFDGNVGNVHPSDQSGRYLILNGDGWKVRIIYAIIRENEGKRTLCVTTNADSFSEEAGQCFA